MKAVVAAFNQEKALVGAFSVITNLRMELFQAPVALCPGQLPAHAQYCSRAHNCNVLYWQNFICIHFSREVLILNEAQNFYPQSH